MLFSRFQRDFQDPRGWWQVYSLPARFYLLRQRPEALRQHALHLRQVGHVPHLRVHLQEQERVEGAHENQARSLPKATAGTH